MSRGPASRAFVGRDSALVTLDDALDRAARGSGTAVLCTGEAGIGKTRLANELRIRAEAKGATTLRGGAIEAGAGGLPFGPIVEALRIGVDRGVIDVEALRPAIRDEIATLIPAFRPASGRPPSRPGERVVDGFARVRLFEAILATLVATSGSAPLVMILEDIHWADRSTLDLIGFLAHNLAERRILLILTLRPASSGNDELRRWVAEFARRPEVERLELQPLGRPDVERLVAALLGAVPEQRLVEAVVQRSDGNPFAIEELTAMAVDGDADAMPPALRDSILASLATLGPLGRATVGAAAVLGDPIDESILAAMVGVPERDLLPGLRELVAGRILVVDQATETFAFRHDLTREVAYTDLLVAERRTLHGRAADALDRRRRDRPGRGAGDAMLSARIAYHRTAAGEPGPAFEAVLAAADAAWAVLAFAEAASFLAQALALWASLPAPVSRRPDRADVAARAAEAFFLAGDPERATELVTAALDWLGPTGSRLRRGLAWERLAFYRFYGGTAGRLEAAREAIRLLPSRAPRGARVQATFAVVEQLTLAGDLAGARAAVDQGIRFARSGGWLAHEALAIANRTLIAGAGTFATALEACRAGVRLGIERGEPEVVGTAYVNLVYCLSILGRVGEAVAVTREALEVAPRIGFGDLLRLQIAANGTDALILAGHWAETARLLQSLAVAESSVGAWIRDQSRTALAVVRGDVDDPILAPGAGPAAESLAGQALDWYHAVAADAAHLRGDLAAGRAHVDAALNSTSPLVWRSISQPPAILTGLTIEVTATARARMDRDAAALELAARRAAVLTEATDRLLAELSDEYVLARCYLATARAEATRLAGPGDGMMWRLAGDAWADLPAPYWTQLCRLGEAEARLGLVDDRADAEALLQAAHRAAVALGARQLEADAAALAARWRIALAPEPAEAVAGPATVRRSPSLSHREREVLTLVADGLTNREIGERLFISPKTAGVHVSNVLAKLGARGRIEAASMARRAGLLLD